jgi:CBS domain containing-hemolysin-like protein
VIPLALVALLLVSFTFSGIEAGILSVNRVRLRHRVDLGDPAARRLQRLLARPERLLVTVLLVTNLANLGAMMAVTHLAVSHFGRAAGYLLALAICLPLFAVGIESLPKSIFRRFPYRLLALLSRLISAADLLLSPLLFAGSLAARVVRGQLPEERKLFTGREDFKYLTIESERQGTISMTERKMIHGVVDFRAVTASDVMVPLASATTVKAAAPAHELLFLAHRDGIDRFPVTAPDGEITGVVNAFEVLLENPGASPVSRFQRRAITVPATEPAYSVIRKLRAARQRIAIVADPAGQPVGIVTHDALILRLVSTATHR